MKFLSTFETVDLLSEYYKAKLSWASRERFTHEKFLEEIISKFTLSASKNGLTQYGLKEHQTEVTIIKEMYEYLKKLEEDFELKISQLEKTRYSLIEKNEPVN